MKFFFLIFLLIVTTAVAFGQISKVYVTNEGAFSDDASKAATYITIEKLSDTAYSVKQFSMANVILVDGVYKDKFLTTPNGKFCYYAPKIGKNSSNGDNMYINSSGYFSNGAKTGTWTEFQINGNKLKEYKYAHNKANGMYREFYEDGVSIVIEGMYVDDLKDGEWKAYTMGSHIPARTILFANDKVIKEINHYTPPVLTDNFYNSIEKALDKYIDTLMYRNAAVTLFISNKGKIDSVKMNRSIDPIIHDDVINAFLKSPRLKPAILDGKPVNDTYLFNFRDFITHQRTEEAIHNANLRRDDVWSRHANDIGRGLNTVGIGKPVN